MEGQDRFLNINNKELHEILNYVKDESIFFADRMRLLTREEILNYKEELNIEIEDIIPLIDIYDNDFIIYDINKNIFAILNIVDECIFGETKTIETYLELLRNYK